MLFHYARASFSRNTKQRGLLSSLMKSSFLEVTPTTTLKTQCRDYATGGPKNFVRLVMVSPDNNNKFYEMNPVDANSFTVTYGRVGSRGTTATFPYQKWDSLYRSKIKKGYVDHTHLLDIEKKPLSDDDDNAEKSLFDSVTPERRIVYSLLKHLQEYSRAHVQANYTVTSTSVSEKLLEEAQKLLDTLAIDKLQELKEHLSNKDKKVHVVDEMNNVLIQLFSVIPRKMSNVKLFLISHDTTMEQVEKLLGQEQSTLDAMKIQVAVSKQQKKMDQQQQQQQQSVKDKYNELLSSLNLEIIPVTDPNEIQEIRSLMEHNASLFSQAFKVVHAKTQANFDRFVQNRPNKTSRLFWHGSRNENWLSILSTGLELRPASALINGKMFGYGTYFADRFQKSLGYTSVTGSYWANGQDKTGFLALYDVHVGTQLIIDRRHSWTSYLDEQSLKKYADYDSVLAKANDNFLRNNEFIIYNEHQSTIKYLVEIKTQ